MPRRMSTQDEEEFPAGRRLLDGINNQDDGSSLDEQLGSEQEDFEEAHPKDDDSNDVEDGSRNDLYVLRMVTAHPAGARSVRINQDTCGCLMTCTLKDGTKRKAVCTKPRNTCNRHTPEQRSERSVKEMDCY